jgi:hypothetical protein
MAGVLEAARAWLADAVLVARRSTSADVLLGPAGAIQDEDAQGELRRCRGILERCLEAAASAGGEEAEGGGDPLLPLQQVTSGAMKALRDAQVRWVRRGGGGGACEAAARLATGRAHTCRTRAATASHPPLTWRAPAGILAEGEHTVAAPVCAGVLPQSDVSAHSHGP